MRALEFTTSNFFEPWLYGWRTGISALALLASAIFWTLLWGWPGLVLATPLTVCLIVLGRHVPQLRFLHVLLGEDAELTPEAKFYERMLAMDQNEAHSIADRFLNKRPLIDFYDSVLLPALGLVEQDRHRGSFDETRGNYLLLSATELVAELSEYKAEAILATSGNGTAPVTNPEPAELHLKRAPVICIPAGDQADELTAMVLAQLLEQSCHNTLLLPTASVTPEILERLGQDPGTILCISALPPFVFTQTRTLCQRIREQLPENRILIGLWQSPQSAEMMRERFGSARPDRVVTTLADALAQIEQWQRGLRDAGGRGYGRASYCGVMMPPTRWRGGSGLPRRSSSMSGFTPGRLADFTPGFDVGLRIRRFGHMRLCRLHRVTHLQTTLPADYTFRHAVERSPGRYRYRWHAPPHLQHYHQPAQPPSLMRCAGCRHPYRDRNRPPSPVR